MTAGAAAGIVTGIMVADRFGRGSLLLKRIGTVLRLVEGLTARPDEDEYDGEDEESEDDEYGFEDQYHGSAEVYGDEYEESGDDLDEEDEEDEEGEEDEEDEEANIDERVLAAFEQDPVLSERAIEIDGRVMKSMLRAVKEYRVLNEEMGLRVE